MSGDRDAYGIFSLRAWWLDAKGVECWGEWLVHRPPACGLDEWHAWIECHFLPSKAGPLRVGYSLARPWQREPLYRLDARARLVE